MLELLVMYLPRRLKGISENSRQSGSVVHLPVKTGSLHIRNSINGTVVEQMLYSSVALIIAGVIQFYIIANMKSK
jgi:hypothetical protein